MKAAVKPTIPVHALGDQRIHLALPHLGRLRQGQLKTLCGLQAVTELSPFILAQKGQRRCRRCFRQVDDDFLLKVPLKSADRAVPHSAGAPARRRLETPPSRK